MIKSILRYLKGVILGPYYIKKTYEILNKSRDFASPEQEKNKSISQDLKIAGAVTLGDVVIVKGINFKLQPPRVIETIHEVLLRDDYSFFYDSGAFIMIDVGMNVGIASLSKAKDARFNKVYAFEPLTPTYNLALQNIKINPALESKIEAFNFGLSDHDEELEINFTEDHIMSVSSESTFDSCFSTNVRKERIFVRRASKTLEPIIIKHKRQDHEKVFLKIDCEGAEFKIIKDLDGDGLLKDVDVAVIEWHSKDPDEIVETLTRNGFFCFKSYINLEWNVGLIKAVKIGPPSTP